MLTVACPATNARRCSWDPIKLATAARAHEMKECGEPVLSFERATRPPRQSREQTDRHGNHAKRVRKTRPLSGPAFAVDRKGTTCWRSDTRWDGGAGKKSFQRNNAGVTVKIANRWEIGSRNHHKGGTDEAQEDRKRRRDEGEQGEKTKTNQERTELGAGKGKRNSERRTREGPQQRCHSVASHDKPRLIQDSRVFSVRSA